MAPTDHDNLPEDLQGDLHRLLPSPPPHLCDRERGMLAQAHQILNQQHGQGSRTAGWRWLAAGSAAAAVLLVAVTLFRGSSNPAAAPPAPVVTATKPTIIDAMIAARRAGAKQAEIDRIAMAAVSLDTPEVH